ncbi:hypothetical protein [Actinomycetospora lemnae]|uniref:Uncharacterized protein n=1 Tax=Actinomycetospora lemnae TaxID=3019891 RepID=A0ABT5SYI9_9PSEU|nr:hypothetical protein [Actinomycetospora sp. DW7H6]MDD7967927.1 hypothetical protein [Actinomycetospora sp. DW7H6]
MDQDASSADSTGPAPGPPAPRHESAPEAFPPLPSPAARARYRPLRPIEELIDDVLGRTG